MPMAAEQALMATTKRKDEYWFAHDCAFIHRRIAPSCVASRSPAAHTADGIIPADPAAASGIEAAGGRCASVLNGNRFARPRHRATM